MTRRRWTYTMGGNPLSEPIEVTEDFQAAPERSGALVMVDRFMEGDRATDGTDIGSRAKRRQYMQAHGLADVSDFTEHWKKAEAERNNLSRGKAERVESIRKAFHALEQKWRK
jgi:hypothetical protein